MKKTLIVAGLIGVAGLALAAPAAAAPDSTVSCSPMPLCTINGQIGDWQQSVTDYVTKGPVAFAGSVTDFVTNGPTTFQDSVTDFVTNGPKTFQDSITNPGGTG
jgi:ABC-type sugar transport system substrate-binding protein